MNDWDVSLDDAVRPPADGLSAAPRWLFAVLAVVVLVVGFVVWHPGGDETPPPSRPSVVGDRLLTPVRLKVPAGAVTTANAGYVGLSYTAGGAMLVTVPDEVVQPGGGRAVMPADPVGWLEQHPDVFVSRARTVTVAGLTVMQLDYRRSRNAQPTSEFARLPLFCTGDDDCTRITSNARVRATFVPLGGRILLVEAVWRSDLTPSAWRMPAGLRKAYTELLESLTSPGRGPSSSASSASGSR